MDALPLVRYSASRLYMPVSESLTLDARPGALCWCRYSRAVTRKRDACSMVALVALGIDPVERDAVAAEQEQAAQDAAIGRDTYAVKVAQRQALIARVEAAVLRGEVDAANAAWDRLFDIVTALRISELNVRRKGADEAERATKLANYTAAREDSLRIRQWARSVQPA